MWVPDCWYRALAFTLPSPFSLEQAIMYREKIDPSIDPLQQSLLLCCFKTLGLGTEAQKWGRGKSSSEGKRWKGKKISAISFTVCLLTRHQFNLLNGDQKLSPMSWCSSLTQYISRCLSSVLCVPTDLSQSVFSEQPVLATGQWENICNVSCPNLQAGLGCRDLALCVCFPVVLQCCRSPLSLETIRKMPNMRKTYEPFEHAVCFEGCFAGW